MSGIKMMKRTRGIEQFEFIGLEEALERISSNKEKRRLKRIAEKEGIAKMKEVELQNELQKHLDDPQDFRELETSNAQILDRNEIESDLFWEAQSISSDDNPPRNQRQDDTKKLEVHNISIVEEPVHNRQTSVLITVAGWVPYDDDDHTFPFSVLEVGQNGDQYTLIWETKVLQDLGTMLSILVSEVASFIFQQGLQATLLPVLMGALTGPMWLIKLTYLVDNPWGNAMTKAEKAGRLLADTLIGQAQSQRPVTLIGFSLGARLIYYCLLELSAKGAYGIIEEVYMLGTPVVSSPREWAKISEVVAGKIFNGYTNNDMLLGVLFRASVASYEHVPGLSAIGSVPNLENVDLTDIINGHMEYYVKLPLILKKVGFCTNSDTFEDQDAENARIKAELEKEKMEMQEKQNAAKIQAQIRRMEEQQISNQRRLFAQKMSDERLRLEMEAAESEKKRLESESRKSDRMEKYNMIVSKELSEDSLAAAELREMVAVKDLMEDYWQPRELESTLPALVIKKSQIETSPTEGANDNSPSNLISKDIKDINVDTVESSDQTSSILDSSEIDIQKSKVENISVNSVNIDPLE
jgi:hypothetical protein